jgi:hypothetical protein
MAEKAQPRQERGLVQYTGRSKTNEGTFAGVWDSRCRQSFTLGLHTMVFQTKIYANKACIMENIENSYTGRIIYILPDTQGALKALDSFWIIPNYSQTAINPW